jgi:four helix bundle protein
VNASYLQVQLRMSRFGADTVKFIEPLKNCGIPGFIIDQLARSATSVGANFAEARGAESRKDFIHKLQLALKECREAKHWLTILQERPLAPQRSVTSLLGECDQLCAILYTSVITAKQPITATSTEHST